MFSVMFVCSQGIVQCDHYPLCIGPHTFKWHLVFRTGDLFKFVYFRTSLDSPPPQFPHQYWHVVNAYWSTYGGRASGMHLTGMFICCLFANSKAELLPYCQFLICNHIPATKRPCSFFNTSHALTILPRLLNLHEWNHCPPNRTRVRDTSHCLIFVQNFKIPSND